MWRGIGDRRRRNRCKLRLNGLRWVAAAAASPLAAAARTFPTALARRARLVMRCAFREKRLVALLGERNALSDQFFDRCHRLLVERGDDGNRGAGAAGAPGAADPVDVIVGVMRNVEIEHVAD